MSMKKILIVYPHNPLKPTSGINQRYHNLIQYLHQGGFQIDILTLDNYVDTWEGQESESGSMVNRVFRYNHARGESVASFFKKFNVPRRLYNRIRHPNIIFHHLPDMSFFGLKRMFKRIVKNNDYSHILISYVQWANLAHPSIHRTCRCILDITDFLTQQLFEITEGKIRMGQLLTEEITRIGRFKHVMCIAPQEQWLFSALTRDTTFYHVPHFMDPPPLTYASVQRYDILFVGANNPNNVAGIRWFLEEVFPLLAPDIKILIVGEISRHIPRLKNIDPVKHVKDLDTIYNQSKIAICPLLAGTGLKIKIVEAMAHGLPVVTTARGLSGFVSTTDNGCLVAQSSQQFARQIMDLLKDKRLYQRVSQLGRTYFKNHFSSESVTPKLDQIFSG